MTGKNLLNKSIRKNQKKTKLNNELPKENHRNRDKDNVNRMEEIIRDIESSITSLDEGSQETFNENIMRR